MTELTIVQPYIPAYRVAFFEQLTAELARDSIAVRVIAGRPTGAQAQRGDAAQPEWLELIDERVVRIGQRHVSLANSKSLWAHSDAVIVPHQGSSLDALGALARRGDQRVGVWGHIAPYTSPLNPLDGAIERWQLRRADHVFAYTAGGRDFATRSGIAAEKITVLNNTTDTTALLAAMAELTSQDRENFRRDTGLQGRPYLTYIGGLDATKRISFLAAALQELHRRGSDVHIAVAGLGNQSALLDQAVERGQVTFVGYADTRLKAVLLADTLGLVSPGRVGLLAIDALVVRRPIVTTEWPWHAPEFDYLEREGSVLVSRNDPHHYADALEKLARSGQLDPNFVWPPPPTLAQMVANFARGVRQLVAR